VPNPFSRIVSGAKISLRADALADKPDMAVLVSQIFAVWADIEFHLSLLLVQMLGADEHPAVAMYSTITSQYMQSRAVDAAARAALSGDDYQIFLAMVSVVESVRTPRNQLAHWLWGVCEQRPDLLAVADPKMIKTTHLRARRVALKDFRIKGDEAQPYAFDLDHVVGYSTADLERAKSDLEQARAIVIGVGHYFDPGFLKKLLSSNRKTGAAFQSMGLDEMRSEFLKVLQKMRPFSEALERTRAGGRDVKSR
jgi:hypothetical protein